MSSANRGQLAAGLLMVAAFAAVVYATTPKGNDNSVTFTFSPHEQPETVISDCETYCTLPLRGITNSDGSSCFINSAMQLAFAVPALCRIVVCGASLLQPEPEGAPTKLLPSQKMLGPIFRVLAESYRRAAPNSAVTAKDAGLLRAVLHRAELVGRHGEEDSSDFLLKLLARFNDTDKDRESVLSYLRSYKQFNWTTEPPLHDGRDPGADTVCEDQQSSSLHTFLKGFTRQTPIGTALAAAHPTKCETVGSSEKTVMIMLPVQGSASDSLVTMFESEFKIETVDDPGNALLASINGSNYEFPRYQIIKQVLSPLPRCLLIGLKRFDMDYTTLTPVKISSAVSMPLEIEYPPCARRENVDSRQCTYRLEGFVTHIGSSAESGHYVAVVRGRGSDTARSKWYHISDDIVREIDLVTVQTLADTCLYAAYSSNRNAEVAPHDNEHAANRGSGS